MGWLSYIPEDAKGMANSVDPDQKWRAVGTLIGLYL